ncbi:ribosome biogenesis GTPase Der [Mycoplasma mycoides subsp. mycoides]|uniref:GTPase Der n=2 Tax=Mycoplasma mycoides subsp. mycoides TaxID=2103 RepID=DER_MYCMS|nr:ribosome biogenesis GTPase Der [Mycoplasma mycoides]Q6MTJ6.1 RecName: Full=GTPase Der; AltName: Full=GTP-binding protein EngA [Mycoplasma mycoides subsp. mycoides SC str. PG1]ADK69873.1 ribosome-associated GTPase EngA [Mycoplasma mycoides subsp. mycoides SC str. Gladysdale]AME10616.1 GTP-binding protein EngA [Mycoplasma mycoides subsp. mycoides]AME11623.1 GTP-binding protein EngA [Mycoplasma mycoides subsp. mycoides]AME13681.1 GTP-binding protein EngA [Mycoplasma mycoides subsp. mycoides]A
MKKKIVAIIGRPNVGKSSLFNRIIKEKKSIVDNKPGVTRDRIYSNAEWLTREFILVDTGGISIDQQLFSNEIQIQTQIAIEQADVIIFVVDFLNRLDKDDKMIAKILHKSKKPVILAINKYDKKTIDDHNYEFMNLGFSDLYFISSTHGIGIGDLLDKVISYISKNDVDLKDDSTKIAIIGRPNVGKSSLVNSLVNENRMIVSEIEGTTLDAVDISFSYNKNKYTVIDTAGIRKKSKLGQTVEKYSYLRSLSAITNSDIVLLMIDATKPITDQDTNIGGLIYDEKKPVIIVVNKWDLVKNKQEQILKKEEEIRAYFKYISYAKIIFISALDKTRVTKILDLVADIKQSLSVKVKTYVLNEVLNKAQLINPAPEFNGNRLKIYYASQVQAYIPTFVLFCNHPNYLHFSYKRFLENQIRFSFGFDSIPINLIFRERK